MIVTTTLITSHHWRWARHQKYLWDLIEKPDTSPAAKWMSYIRFLPSNLINIWSQQFSQHDVCGDLHGGDVLEHDARLPAHRPARYQILFSYVSSSTPHPRQWASGWVVVSTSVASRLASLFQYFSWYFYRTHVYMGSDLWVLVSVTDWYQLNTNWWYQ